MYDKSLIAHLLPSEMIIKNYIHGDPNCNYEKYLLEFINASDFFLAKSGGDIYRLPKSEENGQCDCISASYQLDFKLIASKTALQARSILCPSKAAITSGVIVTGEPKVKEGSIKATRIHAALAKARSVLTLQREDMRPHIPVVLVQLPHGLFQIYCLLITKEPVVTEPLRARPSGNVLHVAV